MHYGVFDEKCAGCKKEIRHIEDIELSIGSEHFCKDCVSFCDICGAATPLKYLTQKTYYNGRIINVCPSSIHRYIEDGDGYFEPWVCNKKHICVGCFFKYCEYWEKREENNFNKEQNMIKTFAQLIKPLQKEAEHFIDVAIVSSFKDCDFLGEKLIRKNNDEFCIFCDINDKYILSQNGVIQKNDCISLDFITLNNYEISIHLHPNENKIQLFFFTRYDNVTLESSININKELSFNLWNRIISDYNCMLLEISD